MPNAKIKKRRTFASARAFAFLIFNFAFLISTAFAHDPLEISATVYLHTNRLELRAVMMRKTILFAADHQGVPLLDFSIPAEREEALPMLRSLAPGLFTLTCGTNVLIPTDTKVILGAEDHVGFNLVFPTTNKPVKFDAKLLAHLPAQDPYGVNVTVLDLVNNRVLEQKLLNAPNPTIEIALPSLPLERRSPNRLDDAPSPKRAGSETGVPK